MSLQTASSCPFEFVILDAPQLANCVADSEAFSEHIAPVSGKETSCIFRNLGGDSTLVAPAQATPQNQLYAHIASFYREATVTQRDMQWRALGRAIEEHGERLGQDATIWVSTSGLGIFWLHMRVDSRPKYYHYSPYKEAIR